MHGIACDQEGDSLDEINDGGQLVSNILIHHLLYLHHTTPASTKVRHINTREQTPRNTEHTRLSMVSNYACTHNRPASLLWLLNWSAPASFPPM